MVYLFDKIYEWVELTEDSNTPTPGRKVVNIAYLLISELGECKKPVRIGKTCRLD